MQIYMQRLSNSLRIQMLSIKSNLLRHVLVLLVVVQTANYQNTLTYLQCKVFTAERNMEMSVATVASDGLYGDSIMIIWQVHNKRISIKRTK